MVRATLNPSLRLAGAGGEGSGGGALGGLGLDFVDFEVGLGDGLEECGGLLFSVEVAVELGLEGLAAVLGAHLGGDAEVGLALEVLDFLLSLDDESDGNALDAAGTQGGLDLAPQDGADFVAHNTVEDAAGLLGVDKVHVDLARVLDGVEDGGLGDFVEDNALGGRGVELQRLLQMPCNGFSLAVLIGCQPHAVGLLDGFLQFADQRPLVVADLVLRRVSVLHVDAHLFLGKVADVSVTGTDGVVLTEEFLNGFRLGRRLNYY